MIDTAARIGGEEFALLLPGTGLARALKLLQRIQSIIQTTRITCGDARLSMTMSMGVASYRGKLTPDPVKLLAEADKALYRSTPARLPSLRVQRPLRHWKRAVRCRSRAGRRLS